MGKSARTLLPLPTKRGGASSGNREQMLDFVPKPTRFAGKWILDKVGFFFLINKPCGAELNSMTARSFLAAIASEYS